MARRRPPRDVRGILEEKTMRTQFQSRTVTALLLSVSVTAGVRAAVPVHVFEKVELSLSATAKYANPVWSNYPDEHAEFYDGCSSCQTTNGLGC